MNQPTKQTYSNDLVFQGLFYIPMMCLYFIGFIAPGAFFIAMLLQFFVGVSQVMSGIFHASRYEDQAHKGYLGIAIPYVIFLFLGGTALGYMNIPGAEMLTILFLFIFPVGIATWYYRLTWLAYKNADDFAQENRLNTPFQEDILDDIVL